MEIKQFERKNVDTKVIDVVTSNLEEFAEPAKDERKRRLFAIESMMIRCYIENPNLTFSECRRAVIEAFPNNPIAEREHIATCADRARLSLNTVRAELAEWGRRFASTVYLAMAGDTSAAVQAREMLDGSYSSFGKRHELQSKYGLYSMMLYIPQLRDTKRERLLLDLGERRCRMCIRKILASLEIEATVDEELLELRRISDPEQLRRMVLLARRELEDYKELVEASDSEFENKLEEIKTAELVEFFSLLNNEKYGYLIDTLYLHNKSFAELRRSGTSLPYTVEGVPVTIERLLQFLREAGISPACRLAPHSAHRLTLDKMEGCLFEPSPDRRTPIRNGEEVNVKVMSSGWKYRDAVFAPPVLHEEEEQ